MPRRVVRASLTAVLACLAMTGCDSTTNGRPLAADRTVGTEPPRTPKPRDRDPQAVLTGLRKLDACGIIDPDAARAAGAPAATLLPMGPHSCMLTPAANYAPGDHGVEVLVGKDNPDQFIQYRGAPVTIGGAKAYEYRFDTPRKSCELSFPVSFTRMITFEYQSPDNVDTCPILRRIAEASVSRLRNPDAITVDPAKRPFAAWDGCSFLAQLLGAEAPNYSYASTGPRDPLSGCQTSRKKDQNPNSPPDRRATPKLEVTYNVAPTMQESRQLGGKVADVTKYSNRCALTWNQADSGTGNKWFAALVFTLAAADCDTAAQLAERAVRLADQAPNDSSARPQRPLLYRPDENDVQETGACVDFYVSNGRADCEPYHEVALPHGTDQIMAASTTNRNVQCAVFIDSVKQRFGPDLHAVTWGDHCFFVEPTHTLELRVNVAPEYPPSAYGNRPDLYTERQETRFGGKPAISFWDKSKKTFDIYLSPFNDLTRKGFVHIQVEALEGRGIDPPTSITLDPARAETAKEVITQVTQTYFAG